LTVVWPTSHPSSKLTLHTCSPRHMADDTRSGAYIWPDLSAPRYIPGFVSTTMFQFGSLIFAVMALYLLRKFPYPVKPLVVQVEGQRKVGA